MATPRTIRLFEEIAVLNEIIRNNAKIYKLQECIDPYSAPIRRHQILRRAMSRLYFRRHTLDLMSLAWYLADEGLLEAVGGCRYLEYIAEFHRAMPPHLHRAEAQAPPAQSLS